MKHLLAIPIVLAALAIAPAAASAYVNIDGTNCRLHAYQPMRNTESPGWTVSGLIECNSVWHLFYLEVCMRQLLKGGWKTMQWTCITEDCSETDSCQTRSRTVPYLTKGRWYDVWDWGIVDGRYSAVYAPPGAVQGSGT